MHDDGRSYGYSPVPEYLDVPKPEPRSKGMNLTKFFDNRLNIRLGKAKRNVLVKRGSDNRSGNNGPNYMGLVNSQVIRKVI